MPFNIQGPELIILLVIALLVLGPGKLPEVGSALGKTIREFRKAATDVKDATTLDPAKSVAAPADAPRVTAPAAGQPAAPAAASPEPVAAGVTSATPKAAAEGRGTDAPAS